MRKVLLSAVLAAAVAAAVPVSAAAATVVAGGGSGSASAGSGPGVAAAVTLDNTGIENRIDYFSASVKNPVVPTTETYTYERMTQDIRNLQSRYGSRLTVNTIGTSLDGRTLYELVLGNPSAAKHILIHAGIHAREYMTPLLVMKQLEYGLAFYDSGSFDGVPLSQLLSQVAVHFVPMVNPDGISLCQSGIGALHSPDLQAAVRRCYESDTAQGRTAREFDDYLRYWKANARGVDLNQNFPADWDQVVSCPDPSYGTYRGTEPLSEPESQALANLTASRTWAATVSYHSMGNLIYWDYEGNRVSQQSGELATVVQANTGYGIGGTSGHGGYKDWAQIRENPIPSLTIETGSVACPLPLSQFPDIWNRNKMVWALVAEYAMNH